MNCNKILQAAIRHGWWIQGYEAGAFNNKLIYNNKDFIFLFPMFCLLMFVSLTERHQYSITGYKELVAGWFAVFGSSPIYWTISMVMVVDSKFGSFIKQSNNEKFNQKKFFVCFCCGLFFGWQIIKKYYLNKIEMGMRWRTRGGRDRYRIHPNPFKTTIQQNVNNNNNEFRSIYLFAFCCCSFLVRQRLINRVFFESFLFLVRYYY